MKNMLLFILGLCGFAAAAQRSGTELSGIVTDTKTGMPVPGVSIILSDQRTGTITDSLGHYRFRNITTGHHIIEVSHLGYKTLVVHVDIAANEVHHFNLEPSFLKNEGVTITAVGNATSIRKAPIPISRISRAELMAVASSNIIDALSKQPGISQVSTGPAISKPVIRGLGYNRLVVINDGIRQEGQQWGDEHGIEIDEASVNRVEIVKGPASLIYGSDAIAGVINIVTTVPVPVNTIRGSVTTAYQTNNRQASLSANIAGNKNGFNWNAWTSHRSAIDYKNKFDGRVFNSKFNEHNAGGYMGYNGSWGFVHLIMSSFNQEAGVIEGARDAQGRFVKPDAGGSTLVTGNDFESRQPLLPFQRINHLKWALDNSFRMKKGRLNVNLGWQRNRRKEFGDPASPGIPELYFNLGTISYNAAYHFDHKEGWSISAGANGMHQENKNRGEEVLIPEYRVLDIGAFVYSSKTIGKTTVSGGLRLDNRQLKSKELFDGADQKFAALEKSFSNFSMSAGLSYAATPQSVWKLNLARGFRAPGIPELASNGTHEGTNRYEYGNNGLNSERSLQADLGWEAHSDHLSVSANLFMNRISDFIFYSRLQGSGGSDSLVEVDGEWIPAFQFGQQHALLYGMELVTDLHPHPFDWLHWQNSFSYVRGQFEEPIEGIRALPLIPAPRWITELRAELLPSGKRLRNLVVQFEVDHSFKQQHPFTAYGTETATSGYTLLNASVHTAVLRRGRILVHLYLNATNLGDVAYQSHLSRLKYAEANAITGRAGVFNMGRNFSLRLNVPFSL